MEVRLLGPIEVGPATAPILIAASKQRTLLAALALRPGRPVPLDVLTETLWSQEAPPSAAKLLQTYVSRLRRVLPLPAALVTKPPGYALEVPADSVDAIRFEQLVDAGGHARAIGANQDAAILLRQALDLWRGDALLDVTQAAIFDAEVIRLNELRLRALESWYATRIDLGEASAVASDLQVLASEYPLREGLQETLVLALSLSGRQAEAVSAYDAVRTTLRDELGLDPGAGLRDLHTRLLRQELHPPTPAAPRDHQLPTPVTATIGREEELQALAALLLDRSNRLITLFGPGGIGKTRLATVAATRAAASYSGGVLMIPLEAVHDPGVGMAMVASALGAVDSGVDTVGTTARAIARRELLLVLDNLEQVVSIAAPLSELLAQAPALTLLVTSRTVLDVRGERTFPVPPLALPGPVGRASVADSAAVALFSERARAAMSSFALTEANAADVAELCRRLDGLPLGIELAAAQSRVLSPAQMLQRLSSRLDVSTSGQRDRPLRHQSLRSAIDGSYELLSPLGRELLDALSVFAGGFDLLAAETVCGATAQSLGELVDHSLVQVTDVPERRFRLLETVREYASERLAKGAAAAGQRRGVPLPDEPALPAERGGAEDAFAAVLERFGLNDAHGRHAGYYLVLATGLNLEAGRLTAAPPRMDVALLEQDNVRAALTWCLSSGSIALGLELATALEFLWVAHHPRDGMRWFSELLAAANDRVVDHVVLAHALRAYGTAADIAGDDSAAASLYQRSLSLFRRLADDRGQAVLLQRLGVQEMRRGQVTAARSLVEQSAELHGRHEDPFVRLWGRVQTTGTLGAIARDTGNASAAAELFRQSCALAREADIRWWQAQTEAELAAVLLSVGRAEEAGLHAREALARAEDGFTPVFCVAILAAVAAVQGQCERAGQLWAVVEHDEAVGPLGGLRRSRPAVAAVVHTARARLRARPRGWPGLDSRRSRGTRTRERRAVRARPEPRPLPGLVTILSP